MSNIEYHYDIIQGTDEWLDLRMGLLTASDMKKLITPAKLELSTGAEAKSHFDEILSQRIDPSLRYNFVSDDMMRGIEDEPHAIKAYQEAYKQEVKRCGFVTNKISGGKVGYSPDGLVGDDGLIEIKSRSPKLQTKTILDHIAGRLDTLIPDDFMMQCQSGLLISERKWLDFISYCNGHPMVCIRVEPIAKYQDAIKNAIKVFEETLSVNMRKYMSVVENDRRLTPTERREIQEIYV